MNNLPATRKPVIDLVPADKERDRAMRADSVRDAVHAAKQMGQWAFVGFIGAWGVALHTGALIRGEPLIYESSWWAAGLSAGICAVCGFRGWRARQRCRRYLEKIGIDE